MRILGTLTGRLGRAVPPRPSRWSHAAHAHMQEVIEQEEPLLELPASEEHEGIPLTLGQRIKLDHLGPAIIQGDGTLRRITNWHLLTQAEKAVAMRRIVDRNKVSGGCLHATHTAFLPPAHSCAPYPLSPLFLQPHSAILNLKPICRIG
jgi:hypothetical protein